MLGFSGGKPCNSMQAFRRMVWSLVSNVLGSFFYISNVVRGSP